MTALSSRCGLVGSRFQNRRFYGLQDAVKRAKPVILEPIMKVEVIVPEKFMGDVTGNLNSKRYQIENMGGKERFESD